MTIAQPASTSASSSPRTIGSSASVDRPAVGVVAAGLDPAGERVRAGDAAFSSGPGGAARAAARFVDHAEPLRRAQLAYDPVPAALVVRGRAERGAARARARALEVRVEGEVEVEARLLAVGDHVEAGAHLVADRGRDGVARRLLEVVRPELVECSRDELEPAGNG